VEIRTLQYVVTLAEELHFGRAARRHFISAQPFGQYIRRLEEEIGVRLFERTSRRVALTPAGDEFVDRARVVLAQVERMREPGVDFTPADGAPLRLGILGFGAGHRWPELHEAIRAQLPALPLEHHELDLENQYDVVRRGDVDVGIVHHVGAIEGLELQPILSSPRVAVVPAASAMADATVLTGTELADCPWLNVASREPALHSWVGLALGTSAPAVRHPAAIPATVATTGRVLLHAAMAADFYPRPDVRFVPAEGPDVEVALATRADDPRPVVEAVRRAAATVRGLASLRSSAASQPI
jgi:DNA-binding transcriptional LysR family regulator